MADSHQASRMTGMCGALGVSEATRMDLQREFAEVWTTVSTESWSRGFLSVHPSRPGIHLHRDRGGWMVAADGERYLLGHLPDFAEHSIGSLSEGRTPSVPAYWRGNGVAIDPDRDLVHLATEWTGTFPLYYSRTAGGFAFSSHLRPLARAIGAAPDHLGALEFLRRGFTLAGRTPFEGISRLLPGQSVTYRGAEDRARVEEHSTLWARTGPVETSSVESTAAELWKLLGRAVSTGMDGTGRYALMMSGGWDSRTLLAAVRSVVPATSVLCYSHGQTDSRELGLVRDIAAQAGVESVQRSIDGSVWDPAVLDSRFAKTENVCFPSWHAAGRRFGRLDVSNLTAGVFSPPIGGHHGAPSVRDGAGKMLSLSKRLLGHYRARLPGGRFGARDSGGVEEAYRALRVEDVGSHWYLRRGVEESLGDVAARLNADLKDSLERYEERGIRGLDAVVEAFNAEFRSCQFINAQLRSCRPDVDVAFPFIDRRLLRLATRLPLELKLHNYLNQQMLWRAAPDLLEFPMGATLVKASRPIWLQEISRVARRTLEDLEWKRYLASEGARSEPRWGWVNFEFLRDGDAFSRIREALQSDLWDMEGIRAMEEDITSFRYARRLHPVYDQMSKVYTLDLLYR